MFKVVAVMFQQIMTVLSGAEAEEETNGHCKKCVKTHEANGH
jgi:hypothetical protein